MCKLQICVLSLLLLIQTIYSLDLRVRNDDYELIRPIKYYFHLLELKAGTTKII